MQHNTIQTFFPFESGFNIVRWLYHCMMSLYSKNKNTALALKHARVMVGLNPTHQESHILMAQCAIRHSQYALALAHAHQALALTATKHTQQPLLLLLAHTYLQANMPHEAMSYAIESQNTTLLVTLAQYFITHKDPHSAQECLLAIQDKTNAQAFQNMYHELGILFFDVHLDTCRLWLNKSGNAEVLYQYGKILEKKHVFNQALLFYQAALRMNPTSTSIQQAIEQIYIQIT